MTDERGPGGRPTVVMLTTRDRPPVEGVAVERTDDPGRARRLLAEEPAACLVVDHDPPDIEAPSFLTDLQQPIRAVPAVVYDATDDPRVASEAVAAGADEYVPASGEDAPAAELADRVSACLDRELRAGIDLWTVFEAIDDGIVIHGEESAEILTCNRAFAEMLGYEREDLVGRPIEAVSADDQPVDTSPDEHVRLAAERGSYVFEWADRTADGERLPVEVNLTLAEFGGERYVVSMVRDISERKRRERTLETLQRTLNSLIGATSSESVAETTVEAAGEVLDYPAASVYLYDEETDSLRPAASADGVRELVGEPPVFDGSGSLAWQVYQEQEPARFDDVAEHEAAHNPETAVGSEYVLPLGAHGVMLAAVPPAASLDDRHLRLTRLLAAATETALDRLERERDLRTFETAIEAAAEGIAILDDDGVYQFVNRAHAGLYGFDDPATLEGRNWRTLYGEDEVERFEAEVFPALEATGSWEGEATGRRRDGSSFHQHLSLSDLGTDGLVCTVRDISDRRARRRELQRKNERLQRFSSVVTHDLRSPLQSARAELSLLRAETDSDYVGDLAGTIDRMEGIVEEVLALTRDGAETVDPAPVDLDATVRSAWSTVDAGGARLTTGGLGIVRADGNRLQRLLENLFRNAVEHGSTSPASHAQQDSVEHGSTSSRSAAEDTVEHGSTGPASHAQQDAVNVRVTRTADGFAVADDGPGIPPGEADAVFDRGYTTDPDGSGMGLDIVRRIADLHDWSVSLEESAEGGARFEFSGVAFPTGGAE